MFTYVVVMSKNSGCTVQQVIVYLPSLVSKIDGLTGYSLVLVYYIGTGKFLRIKQWWINEDSLYTAYH